MLENNKITNKKELKRNKLLYPIIILVLLILIIGIVSYLKIEDIETVKNSVVMIKVYDKNNNEISTGSGFCTYKSNYIVTNFHVIEGAYKIKIITDDNTEYSVQDVLVFNVIDDLAILSGDFELEPLKIGNISNLKAGDEVTAIGSPKGQLNTVSTGVISNADNDYEIRITAPISPGSSGGVLLDKKGKIIGITYATYNSVDSQNINYAISVKYLVEMHNALNNNECNNVTSSNYDTYTPNITNGISYIFDKYFYSAPNQLSFESRQNQKNYSSDSLYTFYLATNKCEMFNRAINKLGELSLKETYNKMNEKEKEKVIENYEYLLNFDSYKKELSSDITSWSKEQFILELKIMQAHELAIFMVELENWVNQEEMATFIRKINTTYEKRMILWKLLNPNDNSYNKEIIEVFSKDEFQIIKRSEKIELLRYLGFSVTSDGTVYY